VNPPDPELEEDKIDDVEGLNANPPGLGSVCVEGESLAGPAGIPPDPGIKLFNLCAEGKTASDPPDLDL